ncbi:MAG: hypothetical protein ACK4YP_06885 [Myxococcota bacterium]
MLGLLMSCALRATGTGADERARALDEADALWAARATPGTLDTAMDRWLARLAEDPEDPVVLARLSRGEWTRGQIDPAGAVPHFETGQDYGWRCLLGWPAFAVTIDAVGYSVTPEAVSALPPEAATCLLWTAANGLSLVAARGPGAALELDGVRVLLDRLGQLAAAEDDPGFRAWAEAQLLVLTAAPGPPPAEARGRFTAAIAAAPDVGLFRRDYAAAFPDAANLAWAGFSPGGAWGLENAVWAE